jgi:hypothetical protein
VSSLVLLLWATHSIVPCYELHEVALSKRRRRSNLLRIAHARTHLNLLLGGLGERAEACVQQLADADLLILAALNEIRTAGVQWVPAQLQCGELIAVQERKPIWESGEAVGSEIQLLHQIVHAHPRKSRRVLVASQQRCKAELHRWWVVQRISDERINTIGEDGYKGGKVTKHNVTSFMVRVVEVLFATTKQKGNQHHRWITLLLHRHEVHQPLPVSCTNRGFRCLLSNSST